MVKSTTEEKGNSEEQDEQDNKDREAALRKAYSAATNDLREKYRSDFNEFYAARAKELGYDWSPKPTPVEKARADIERLLEEFPELREEFADDDEDEEPEAPEGEPEEPEGEPEEPKKK